MRENCHIISSRRYYQYNKGSDHLAAFIISTILYISIYRFLLIRLYVRHIIILR